MKTFVLIVTFAATTDLIGVPSASAVLTIIRLVALAGRTLYTQQHCECVPENQHPKEAPASR
jgi:hypothetical protein